MHNMQYYSIEIVQVSNFICIFACYNLLKIKTYIHIKTTLFTMKNFLNYLLATFALVLPMAFVACTDTPDEPTPGKKEAKVEVAVTETSASGATIVVTTQNVKEFAYVQRDSEIPASAILQGDEFKTKIANTEEITNTTITIDGCSAGETYTVFFAFRLADETIYDEVKRVEFTTTSYGDNVLTVVDRMYDGFSVHIQIPEEVKERGNALRYATSSMAMFNYMRSQGMGT